MIAGFISNASAEQRLSGHCVATIMTRKMRGDIVYVAWTRTWEGPPRPEYVAASADLSDRAYAGLL